MKSNFDEESENGVAVDDTDVCGGGRGGDSASPDSPGAEAVEDSLRVFDLSHSPAGALRRPLRRIPAPRFDLCFISMILFQRSAF